MDTQETVTLRPGRWTVVPGTGVAVWWEAGHEVTVRRREGFWDLCPLTIPGRVCAWVRLVDRPQLGSWPITPLATRVTYRSRAAARAGVGAEAV
jgi:hypothetical protein